MINRFLTMFLIAGVSFTACSKHTTPDCIKAKIVRTTCAGIVMQALNSSSLGDDNWKDIFSTDVYDNVFSVNNPCNIASEYKTGDELYITIAKASTTECITCALYDAPPKTVYKVTSIGRLPCTDISK